MKGEAIVIHPPQLEAQKKFLALSYAGRLTCLHEEQKTVLQQVKAIELRHAKALKKEFKEKLFGLKAKTSLSKEKPSVYLSHTKSAIFEQKKIADDENILLNMTEKKLRMFNFFKQLRLMDVKEKSVNDLMVMAKTIHAEEKTPSFYMHSLRSNL